MDNKDDDEMSIDLGKIKEFFKRKKEKSIETKEEPKAEEKQEKIDEFKERLDPKDKEDIAIDFKKIKEKIKGFFKKEEDKKESSEKEDISIDWKKITNFFKNNKYAVPALLILIAIFFSTFFRMYPAYLPITDDWAKSTIYNYYKEQIRNEISKEYPNLPDANKNALVENQFNELLKNQKSAIEQQIRQLSNEYKSHFKYTAENGKEYMYLSDIDTYLWYGEINNYLKNGHFGTDVIDGKEMNMLRNGREGRDAEKNFHTIFGAYLYKIVNIFSNVPFMAVFFYFSPIVIGLSIIPAFFIGKKVSGNVGGFFAAMIVAINSLLLGRTSAAVSDTDPWQTFFPLWIVFLFLYAFEAKETWKKITLASFAGLFAGFYADTWGGWWFVFVFILAAMCLFVMYNILSKKIYNEIKDILITVGTFFFSSIIFVSLLAGFGNIIGLINGPLFVIQMKQVGVTTLWPNVLTTVAEFNEAPLSTIVEQMGGNLLFWTGLMGVALILFRKDKPNYADWFYLGFSGVYYMVMILLKNAFSSPLVFIIFMSVPIVAGLAKIIYFKEYAGIDAKFALLMIVWFAGTVFGYSRGVRFGILMVPAFAAAFGTSAGFVYQHLSKWISKELKIDASITKAVIIILLSLLFIGPIQSAHAVAKNEIILMNDAWYDSLIGIKEDSKDAIITSWWDFGHWFVAIAERRVTFDGGDQGERIHWVGKSLLTNNETVTIGLLRMLNCGQEKAPHVLEKYLDNDTIKAVDILNKIIVEDKKEAEKILKEEGLTNSAIEEVLNVTHCDDLLPQYFITSEDMVGKAAVWGHFGSWDFRRAKIWQTVRKLNYKEGTKMLIEKFNISEKDADNVYYEIQNTDGDRWISPWPSYYGNAKCIKSDKNILECSNGIKFDLLGNNAFIETADGKKYPKKIAVAKEDGSLLVKEYKESLIVMQNGMNLGLVLVPDEKDNSYTLLQMDPLLVDSMFTRLFFMNGHGLRHFSLLSEKKQLIGGRIQVWKVSWEPGEPINALKEKKEL